MALADRARHRVPVIWGGESERELVAKVFPGL